MYRAVAAFETSPAGQPRRGDAEQLKHKKRQNEATVGWHDMLLQLGRRMGHQMCHSCMFLKTRCAAMGCSMSHPPPATSWASSPPTLSSLDAQSARALLLKMVFVRHDPDTGDPVIPPRELASVESARATRVDSEMQAHLHYRHNMKSALAATAGVEEHLPPFLGAEPATLSLHPSWAQYGDETQVELPRPNPLSLMTVSTDSALLVDPWLEWRWEFPPVTASAPSELALVKKGDGAFRGGRSLTTIPAIKMCPLSPLAAQQQLVSDFNARQSARFAAYVVPLGLPGPVSECLLCPRSDTHDVLSCPYQQALRQTNATGLVLMPVPSSVSFNDARFSQCDSLAPVIYTMAIPQPAVTVSRDKLLKLRKMVAHNQPFVKGPVTNSQVAAELLEMAVARELRQVLRFPEITDVMKPAMCPPCVFSWREWRMRHEHQRADTCEPQACTHPHVPSDGALAKISVWSSAMTADWASHFSTVEVTSWLSFLREAPNPSENAVVRKRRLVQVLCQRCCKSDRAAQLRELYASKALTKTLQHSSRASQKHPWPLESEQVVL